MQECNFILFGATGDLAMRKIFPSLYQIYSNHDFAVKMNIIATSRKKFTQEAFKEELETKAKIHIKNKEEQKWAQFLDQIHYVAIELNNSEDFLALKALNEKSKNIVIYFSISPEFFIQACKNLALANLNDERVKIVLEKPLGMDLKSFKAINEEVEKYYKEEQTYRIDHYLGKESVQNLLYLRAYNPFFKRIWNNKHIACVEITVFETLGVENRGEFYDKTGALRDMLQNHMLQILSLVALKIPSKLEANSLRKEKCKVLKELRAFENKTLKNDIIRAQYTKHGDFKAYVEEAYISPQSQTESFVALKTFIDNADWKGVPFYLRTGKRMAEQFAQVVITFKNDISPQNNQLIISLQPQSFMSLNIKVKAENTAKNLKEESLYTQLILANSRPTQPYESLIKDCINGDLSSFNHKEELEAAWIFVDPIIRAWQENLSPLHYYLAGTWGPKEADELIQKDGYGWLNP